jgi:hypothetical protein
MNVQPMTPDDLAARLGLVAAAGEFSLTGVADLVREAVARWGPVRAQVVRQFVKRNAEAAGFGDRWVTKFNLAVEALISLREMEEVLLAAPPPSDDQDAEDEEEASQRPAIGTHLVVAAPHVVSFGERRLVIGDIPAQRVERFGDPNSTPAVARWVDGAEAERLFEEGAIPWTAGDWLGPTALRDHAERRGVAADVAALWRAIEAAANDRADPLDDPNAFDLIGGAPGDFFGKSGEQTGRWRRGGRHPDGVWLGTSRGYRDQHRHPFAVVVRGGAAARALRLFDMDELRWALIGRGQASGRPEVVRVGGDVVRLSCQLPWDLWRLGALCEVEGWRWTTPPGLHAERELAARGLRVELDPRADDRA